MADPSGLSHSQRKAAAKLLFDSGNTELQANRIDQALGLYKRSLELEPENPNTHNNMGIALDRVGKTLEALNTFSKAHLIKPDDSSITANLTATLIKAGRYKTAAQIATKAGSTLPYSMAVTAVRTYLESTSVPQDSEIQGRLQLYNSLVEILGRVPNAPSQILFLSANFKPPINPWREQGLSLLSDAEMKRWVRVEGLDSIKELQANGKGAILLSSHLATGHMGTFALSCLGHRINSIQYLSRPDSYRVRATENIVILSLQNKKGFALREAYLAQKALQRGEILHIAGDGYQGMGGIQIDFLGRIRTFRTGFAELSLMTHAPIFPVFSTISLDGHITVEILPALEFPDTALQRETQVMELVRQYVSLLENYWKSNPENISWPHIRKYLELAK